MHTLKAGANMEKGVETPQEPEDNCCKIVFSLNNNKKDTSGGHREEGFDLGGVGARSPG